MYERLCFGFVLNSAINKREKSVIRTDPYVFTGMVACSSLANDDIAGNGLFPTIFFYTKALGMRVASVL